ncbi:11862_t:CDS:2 [Scutellospora calospora]|uniref:11862_t:CDS:1 n=1 Tax=Scutellospora calospora TaxID=85575 RepID=A0ACA9KCT1_9GLOM|nr:11862_t:CDS:2 [Scutellospora calospora]
MTLNQTNPDIRNLLKNTISEKISIQIDNRTPVTYELNKELTLKDVREQLTNSGEQTRIYEYMNFIGPYGMILRIKESEELLKENLHDGYILKIEKSICPNINETTQRCNLNYGIKMTEDGPENVDEMAFKFSQDITKSVEMRKLNYAEYNKYEGTCENKHENFLRKNLVADAEMSIAIPSNLFVSFTISHERHNNDVNNMEFSSEYKTILLPKYEIEIDIKEVEPTETFIHAVNSALENVNPVNELKRICEKFGEYIASKVKIGGRMNKIVYHNASSTTRQISTKRHAGINFKSELIGSVKGSHNNENSQKESLSTSNIRTHRRVYGGNTNIFDEDNITLWQDSLNDYTTWQVIEYIDLIPIFDVLTPTLRQKVLETMGQKLLYSKIDSVDGIVMSSSKFSYEHQLKIPLNLKINLKESKIFASVMNKDKRAEVFSTRIVVYTLNNSASVVLHWIHKTSRRHKDKVFNLQIAWVIVGQTIDFKYDNCNFHIINSIEEFAPNSTNNNHQISICDEFEKSHSILATCTQLAPQQDIIHPKASTLVTGVHFCCVESQLKACFFMYDLVTEALHRTNFEGKLNNLFIHCSIISIAQKNYLKLNRERNFMNFINNNSTILYNASPLWTCSEPTFVSLFHETCPGCIAGFVNLAPNYLIFNSPSNIRDDPQISYFCAPLFPI